VSLVTNVYSDHDMQCPESYYGGFKEARVLDFGTGERAASDPVTGEPQFATMTIRVSDFDRSIRQRQASASDRYWTEPLTVRMVSREVRAALGTPYTVFTGPIINAQPTGDLEYELQLGDIVSRTLLSDEAVVPYRRIGDGFLNLLDSVSESLNRDWREPIIYGKHRRLVDEDEPSPQGFVYAPIYLGIQTLSAGQWHCWLVAGHACADVPDILVVRTAADGTVTHESVIANEGSQWLVPHSAGWLAEFGAPYVDYASSTYGDQRRYTLIYGAVGETDPDTCATGETPFLIMVDGMESTGAGTGDVEEDGHEQYLHFMQNYAAHSGRQSYMSGAYLTTPNWNLINATTIPVLDDASFTACSLIAQARLPEADGADYPAGYVRACVIGGQGDMPTLRSIVAQFNISCDCQSFVTHDGSFKIFMLSPTAAIKAAAPVYTDVLDILKGGFSTDTRWGAHENVVPFQADLHTGSGAWRTTGKADWTPSVTNWTREIVGQTRAYRFVPGITMAFHLARLAAIRGAQPPRYPVMEGVVGPMAQLEPGSYINVRHYGAVGEPDTDRLAQVQSVAISPTPRTVRVILRDCEDLIEYDAFDYPQPDEGAAAVNVGGGTEIPPDGFDGPFGVF
jgi:hypothetical protein